MELKNNTKLIGFTVTMPREKSADIQFLHNNFELHKEEIFNNTGGINPPSHPVWKTISKEIDYRYSSKYLYTLIKCNRHGFRNKFMPCSNTAELETSLEEGCCSSTSDESTTSFDENQVLKFTITLSAHEWLDIHPECKTYQDGRTYSVLKSGRWADVIASHFWDHTSLPCALTFKRARIYNDPSCFLYICAFCKSCKSHLEGKIPTQPMENKRVMINCIYRGSFQTCKCTSKRQLKGDSRNRIAKQLLSNKLAPSAYRREMAALLMEHGDVEPSIL